MRSTTALLATAALMAATVGCASQSRQLYAWNGYEQLIYDMYMEPGKADPGTQVARLNADIAKAQADGQRVAPGMHAHLGYMYYLSGQADAAVEQFAAEKQLFPESAALMETMIARLQNRGRP